MGLTGSVNFFKEWKIVGNCILLRIFSLESSDLHLSRPPNELGGRRNTRQARTSSAGCLEEIILNLTLS